MRRKLGIQRRLALRLRPCLGDEAGIALVMALGIMLVLVITLTTVITFAAAGARDANRTNAGQKAYALAEAGINNALAVLHRNYPAPFPGAPATQCLLRAPSPLPADVPGQPITGAATCAALPAFTAAPDPARPTEVTTYWGTMRRILGQGNVWVIRATGTVPNPTGPGAAPVSRTITARVPLDTSQPAPGGTGVLDWIYTTTTTITQSVDARSPVYVNGDITFDNTASIRARLYTTGSVTFGNNGSLTGELCVPSAVPGCLNIGGGLIFQNSNNTAGTLAAPLPQAHIAGPCTYRAITTSPSACGTTKPWASTKVFATVKNNTIDTRPFPLMTTSAIPARCADPVNYSCVDYASWYFNSSPGPVVSCNPAGDSLTPTVFDNDQVMNQSVLSSFNLTPAASYTCKTDTGELSWNASGGTNGDGLLTIKGTVFIDGSAYVDQIANRAYSYTGVGQIMLSGSFAMASGHLCAVLTSNGKACNTADSNGWDPNVKALAIVADGNGYAGSPASAGVASGLSAEVKNAEYQGILAGTNSIDVSVSGTKVQGPIMSVNGFVSASQSLGLTFPAIAFAPSSAPGQPPPPATLLTPRDFGGG